MERIPNYDEWKTTQPDNETPKAYCDICGRPLFEGDGVVDFQGEYWCDDCIKDIRRIL